VRDGEIDIYCSMVWERLPRCVRLRNEKEKKERKGNKEREMKKDKKEKRGFIFLVFDFWQFIV
jgi:hypothetical protein